MKPANSNSDSPTLVQYRYTALQFERYLSRTGDAVSPESITGFIDYLKNRRIVHRIGERPKRYKATTINNKIQALKSYLKKTAGNRPALLYAIDQVFKTAKKTKLKKHIETGEYLKPTDIKKIVSKAPPKAGALITFLFHSGLRISEAVNIRFQDTKKSGEYILIRTIGKGQKEHKTYIPIPVFITAVEAFKGEEYLFESEQGGALHRVTAYRMIRKAGERVKLDTYSGKLHPHLLRHSFAMYLKQERGISPDQIQKVLNHSSVATTLEYYFHGEPEPETLFPEGRIL